MFAKAVWSDSGRLPLQHTQTQSMKGPNQAKYTQAWQAHPLAKPEKAIHLPLAALKPASAPELPKCQSIRHRLTPNHLAAAQHATTQVWSSLGIQKGPSRHQGKASPVRVSARDTSLHLTTRLERCKSSKRWLKITAAHRTNAGQPLSLLASSLKTTKQQKARYKKHTCRCISLLAAHNAYVYVSVRHVTNTVCMNGVCKPKIMPPFCAHTLNLARMTGGRSPVVEVKVVCWAECSVGIGVWGLRAQPTRKTAGRSVANALPAHRLERHVPTTPSCPTGVPQFQAKSHAPPATV